MRCIICNNTIRMLHNFYDYCPDCFHIQKKNSGEMEPSLKYHCKFYKENNTNNIIRLLEINKYDNYSHFIKYFKPKNYDCYLEEINLDINITNYKYDIIYINDIFSFIYTPHNILQHIKTLTSEQGKMFITTNLPNFITNLDSIDVSNRLNTKSIFNTNSMKCLCTINNLHLNNALYLPQFGKTCLFEISLYPINVNIMNVYDVLYNEILNNIYSDSTYTQFLNLHFL